MDNSNGNWRIQELWNDLLTEDRPNQPRDYIRASEIGKPYYERYLAMKGVPATNPYTPRVKRIFDVGLVFEVEVVERMFRLLGVLQDAQVEVKYERDDIDMLPIVGHYDHKVGGTINVAQAEEAINNPTVSPWMKQRATRLLQKLLEQYPNGLQTLIAEIKTVNSMAFWAHKNQDVETGFFKGYPNHKLQLLTYLLATGEKEGRLFYISKDDMTLMETSVSADDPELNKLWLDDITTMTKFYREGIEPDKPENIVFNEEKGVFQLNWQVERSPYFTLITGKQSIEDWQDSLKEELKEKNTAKCKDCDKDFTLQTLNKNGGKCGKCAKK